MKLVVFTEDKIVAKVIHTVVDNTVIISEEIKPETKNILLSADFIMVDSNIGFKNWKFLVQEIKYKYRLSYIPIIVLVEKITPSLQSFFRYVGFVEFLPMEKLKKFDLNAITSAFNNIISFYKDLKINNKVKNYFDILITINKDIYKKINYFLDFILNYYKISEEDLFFLKFILNELIDNSLKNSKDKIRIVLFHINKIFVVKIEDFGGGFNSEYILNKDFNTIYNEINEDHMGGLGIFIIKKLVKKIIFNDKGNTVEVEKEL